MDPTETGRMTEVLRPQEARLSHQDEFQMAMASHLATLSSQLQGLLDQLAQPTTAALPPAAAAMPALTRLIVGAGSKLAPQSKSRGNWDCVGLSLLTVQFILN